MVKSLGHFFYFAVRYFFEGAVFGLVHGVCGLCFGFALDAELCFKCLIFFF